MLILSHRRWHNVDVSTVVNEINKDVGRHETWENFRKALDGLESSSLRAMREYTKFNKLYWIITQRKYIMLYKLLLNSILTYTKIIHIHLQDWAVSTVTWSGNSLKTILALGPIHVQVYIIKC